MKRFAIAFLISLVGVISSWYFLRPREWATDSIVLKQSIGKMSGVRNDVSRQEEGRLLWFPVKEGDEIRIGDKIKTAGLSTAVIELSESKSKVEIEENTIIVMGQDKKKFSLNMLEGRVFVKQESSAAGSLDLISGGKRIDVSGNAAVSVSQDGSSQVESFSNSGNIFKDLKPEYSENVIHSKPDTEVSWKSAPSEGVVEIFMGESPLLLKKLDQKSGSFVAGRISVPFKSGLNFWQLVLVVNKKEIKSPLMKINLIRPQSPTPLFPSELEVVRLGEGPFDFKWMKGNTGENVRVELARDEAFQKMIFSTDVKDQTFYTPGSALSPGGYFWKVKSALPDGQWIESRVNSFTVIQGNGQISPTPIAPHEHVTFFLRKNSTRKTRFEWRKQNEVNGYELRVKGPGMDRTIQSTESVSEVPLTKTGKYTWEVLSVDANGKKSLLPVQRDFDVKDMGSISWAMNSRKFMYLSSLPIIILKWLKQVPGPSVLKISQTATLEDAEVFQVRESDFPFRAPKPGTFYAQVVSMNGEEEIQAESPMFDFEVVESPLPAAPLLKGNPTKITTNSQGDLKMEITNIKPDWLAVAQIRNEQGKVLDERRFSDQALHFSGMLPGKYLLLIKFHDEYKRTSEVSTFQVEVPDKSRVPAPKLKGIKVR